jgi:HK97 family phage prohead protease
LWGGDPGYSWAKKLVRQIDAEDARSFEMDIERRDISFEEMPDAELTIETRASGQTAIVGYAARFNVLSLDLGGFREMILPGAFDKVLSRQRGKQDVIAVFNHDPNILLGRTSSGTLELSTDDKGLKYSVTPPAERADIISLILRRDLRGSSFAFTVSKDGESYASDASGAVRSISQISGLYDVGPVVSPAYPSSTTGISMRSFKAWKAQQAAIEKIDAEIAASTHAPNSAVIRSMLRLRAARLRSFIHG